MVDVIPMRRRHVRSVLRIEAQVYPRPWSMSLFMSELALRSTRAYFVARIGREVVGYAGLMMTMEDGHVTTIAVDPKWHREQIGTRLMLGLAREARIREAQNLTLEVRLSNKGAQAMYRQFGFAPVGIRKNYYAETGEDALVMWSREIGAPAYGELLDGLERRRSRWHALRRAQALVKILGIETSCDETAAAVVEDGRYLCSSVVSSQIDLHAPYGGVVPEIASRAHVELINAVIAEALVEAGVELGALDAVAACHGPGLAGALLVGVSAAKAIALSTGLPYIEVNHLEAHLYAAWLEEPDLEMPLAVLIVSGGHTMLVIMEDHGRYRVLGQTVDDAAGEAFDKVARSRARLSRRSGDRPARGDGRRRGDPVSPPDARRQLRLLVLGAEDRGRELRTPPPRRGSARRRRVVSGSGRRRAGREARHRRRRGRCPHTGAGRGRGRELAAPRTVLDAADATGRRAFVPPLSLCTDNGAMIAATAWWRFRADGPSPLSAGATPDLRLPSV